MREETANKFITMQKYKDECWLVEAIGNETQTTVIKQLKHLPNGVYNYSKIGKDLAKSLGLPFVKANETPENLGKKEKKQLAKLEYLARKATIQQNSLKQQWQQWNSKFPNEEVALADGIKVCEELGRDLAVSVTSFSQGYYLFAEPSENEDLSRLAQFNELKNLWLRRDQKNISTVKKLVNKQSRNFLPMSELNNFWDETFFSYFENNQLYLYEVKLRDKHYTLISDLAPSNSNSVIQEVECPYGKSLTSKEKQKIEISFGRLVPIIEWGAHNFWRRYWSKKENRLLPVDNKLN